MPYTMRLTWPDDPDRTDDYVFRHNGKDVGRCYFMVAAGNRAVWLWTIYGSSAGGMELSLADAKAAFRKSYEQGRQGRG